MDSTPSLVVIVNDEDVHDVHKVDAHPLIEIIEGKIEVNYCLSESRIDLRLKGRNAFEQYRGDVLHERRRGELVKDFDRILFLLSESRHALSVLRSVQLCDDE